MQLVLPVKEGEETMILTMIRPWAHPLPPPDPKFSCGADMLPIRERKGAGRYDIDQWHHQWRRSLGVC